MYTSHRVAATERKEEGRKDMDKITLRYTTAIISLSMRMMINDDGDDDTIIQNVHDWWCLSTIQYKYRANYSVLSAT